MLKPIWRNARHIHDAAVRFYAEVREVGPACAATAGVESASFGVIGVRRRGEGGGLRSRSRASLSPVEIDGECAVGRCLRRALRRGTFPARWRCASTRGRRAVCGGRRSSPGASRRDVSSRGRVGGFLGRGRGCPRVRSRARCSVRLSASRSDVSGARAGRRWLLWWRFGHRSRQGSSALSLSSAICGTSRLRRYGTRQLGASRILDDLGLDRLESVGNELVAFLLRWWWIFIPLALLVAIAAVTLTARLIAAPVLRRLKKQSHRHRSTRCLLIRSASTVPVRLIDVGYSFPGSVSPALAGLSLSVGPGELVAVVGANGSGKSTLIRLLAGTAPTSGSISRPGPPGMGRPGGTGLISNAPKRKCWGYGFGMTWCGASPRATTRTCPTCSISSVSPGSRIVRPQRCPAASCSVLRSPECWRAAAIASWAPTRIVAARMAADDPTLPAPRARRRSRGCPCHP